MAHWRNRICGIHSEKCKREDSPAPPARTISKDRTDQAVNGLIKLNSYFEPFLCVFIILNHKMRADAQEVRGARAVAVGGAGGKS
jgi:hypothetical protein